MDAAAEDAYFRSCALPLPWLGTLVSLASAAGMFLLRPSSARP